MSMKTIYNFNAGPATMPTAVLQQLHEELQPTGKPSLLEISHRSKEFVAINEETQTRLRQLLAIPKNYKVLLLPGGASQQFAMVPLNLMDKSADYVLTGHWSEKAAAEADSVGKVNRIDSATENGYQTIPAIEKLAADPTASYLHITSNNTIYGTQYKGFPKTADVPLVADMSSDICSRPVPITDFGLIYACAQKNLGPAGITAVIVRDDLVERNYRTMPSFFRYATHVAKASIYNTPAVFAIYAMCLVLRWIEVEGGLKSIKERNEAKAKLLYDTLDASELYLTHASRESRSMMNVTWRLPTTELTDSFLNQASAAGLQGLKGHRAVGGIRASLYNAMPLAGVQTLIEFIREFERQT